MVDRQDATREHPEPPAGRRLLTGATQRMFRASTDSRTDPQSLENTAAVDCA
jgi:hypothetical protein